MKREYELVIHRALYLPYATLSRAYIRRPASHSRMEELDFDTLGEMYFIERAWRGNAPNVSCIPSSARYPIKRETVGRNFAKFQARWGHDFLIELLDVPKRSQIQIHPGSHSQHSQGCPIPVLQPRLGISILASKCRAAHPDEVYDAHGIDKVRVIAGSGNSRVAYNTLYDAVNNLNITHVAVDKPGA